MLLCLNCVCIICKYPLLICINAEFWHKSHWKILLAMTKLPYEVIIQWKSKIVLPRFVCLHFWIAIILPSRDSIIFYPIKQQNNHFTPKKHNRITLKTQSNIFNAFILYFKNDQFLTYQFVRCNLKTNKLIIWWEFSLVKVSMFRYTNIKFI